MKLPPLILASVSPRRHQLLSSLGLDFTVKSSDAAELHEPEFTATEICQLNSYRKAFAVAKEYPDSLVIGADTLVYKGTELFGKPADLADAHAMISRLQGATHQVITGVCLLQLAQNRKVIFSESTTVNFKPLTNQQISEYLALMNPLDKAGAYAIQEHGDRIIESIEGSLNNVIGLPTERLQRELESWSSGT